jgi:hypothetical protein
VSKRVLKVLGIWLVTLAARADYPQFVISGNGMSGGQTNAPTRDVRFDIQRTTSYPYLFGHFSVQPDETAAHPAVPGVDYEPVSGWFQMLEGDEWESVYVVLPQVPAGQPDRGLKLVIDQLQIWDLAPRIDLPVGNMPNGAAAADFNGDGRQDLVLSKNDGGVVGILENTTEDDISFADQVELDLDIAFNAHAVATADVNADEKPDILVTVGGNELLVLMNTTAEAGAAPTFSAPEPFAVANIPRPVVTADFNLDGRPDVAIGHETNAGGAACPVSVLLNTTPTGAATPSFSTPQLFEAGNVIFALVAADLNNDGRADLAAANQGDNTVSVFINTTPFEATTASFSGPQTYATGTQPWGIAAGDLNYDGMTDLAIANYGSHSVTVLLNDSEVGGTTSAFSANTLAGVVANPKGIAITHLDTEPHLPDLAVGSSLGLAGGESDLVVLRNRTPIYSNDLAFDAQPPVRVAAHADHIVPVKLDGVLPYNDLVTVSGGVSFPASVVPFGDLIETEHSGTTVILATIDPISFPAVTDAALETVVVSEPITVSGITSDMYAPLIDVTGGEFSINGGAFTAIGWATQQGDSVRLRLTSSSAYATAKSATVTIGGVPATFTVTTLADPNPPDPDPAPDPGEDEDDEGEDEDAGALPPAPLLVMGLLLALRRRLRA